MSKKNIELLTDVTIVVPVVELNETTSALFVKALDSVANQKHNVEVLVVQVQGEELNEKIEEAIATSQLELKSVKQIVNDGDTDFCSQVNFAVSTIKTKYFSILELDDEFSEIYFNNVSEYIKAYPNVSAYLPLTVLVNNDNQAVALANEAVWATQFSEKQGFLDMNSLLVYNNFMVSGAIMNTEAFNEIGGFKKDIKLYFTYEFLLRFVNNDYTTMVIPKIGYKHLFEREGSLFIQYRDPITGIKPEEAKFYLESAKKEYFFNTDVPRNLKYSPADMK